jgi:hypothetical protein
MVALAAPLAAAEPVRLRVDFSKPDGTWNMPALALGQGGLQSDPMIEPHVKELRQLRPKTIRLFLSEYYRTGGSRSNGVPSTPIAMAQSVQLLAESLSSCGGFPWIMNTFRTEPIWLVCH